jgi:DNA-binding transcriptional MerR regulator
MIGSCFRASSLAGVRSAARSVRAMSRERAGLIQPTERGERGERRYDSRDLRWVEFLQRLRATRMPVREMKQFAELRRGGAKTVAARRELLASHRRPARRNRATAPRLARDRDEARTPGERCRPRRREGLR